MQGCLIGGNGRGDTRRGGAKRPRTGRYSASSPAVMPPPEPKLQLAREQQDQPSQEAVASQTKERSSTSLFPTALTGGRRLTNSQDLAEACLARTQAVRAISSALFGDPAESSDTAKRTGEDNRSDSSKKSNDHSNSDCNINRGSNAEEGHPSSHSRGGISTPRTATAITVSQVIELRHGDTESRISHSDSNTIKDDQCDDGNNVIGSDSSSGNGGDSQSSRSSSSSEINVDSSSGISLAGSSTARGGAREGVGRSNDSRAVVRVVVGVLVFESLKEGDVAVSSLSLMDDTGKVRLACAPTPPPSWLGEVVCVSGWTLTKETASAATVDRTQRHDGLDESDPPSPSIAHSSSAPSSSCLLSLSCCLEVTEMFQLVRRHKGDETPVFEESSRCDSHSGTIPVSSLDGARAEGTSGRIVEEDAKSGGMGRERRDYSKGSDSGEARRRETGAGSRAGTTEGLVGDWSCVRQANVCRPTLSEVAAKGALGLEAFVGRKGRGPVDVVARVAAVSPVIRFRNAPPFFMVEVEQVEHTRKEQQTRIEDHSHESHRCQRGPKQDQAHRLRPQQQEPQKQPETQGLQQTRPPQQTQRQRSQSEQPQRPQLPSSGLAPYFSPPLPPTATTGRRSSAEILALFPTPAADLPACGAPPLTPNPLGALAPAVGETRISTPRVFGCPTSAGCSKHSVATAVNGSSAESLSERGRDGGAEVIRGRDVCGGGDGGGRDAVGRDDYGGGGDLQDGVRDYHEGDGNSDAIGDVGPKINLVRHAENGRRSAGRSVRSSEYVEASELNKEPEGGEIGEDEQLTAMLVLNGQRCLPWQAFLVPGKTFVFPAVGAFVLGGSPSGKGRSGGGKPRNTYRTFGDADAAKGAEGASRAGGVEIMRHLVEVDVSVGGPVDGGSGGVRYSCGSTTMETTTSPSTSSPWPSQAEEETAVPAETRKRRRSHGRGGRGGAGDVRTFRGDGSSTSGDACQCVLTFEGKISGLAGQAGTYVLDGGKGRPGINLYLQHLPCSSLGAGLRRGAIVRVHNVHPVRAGASLIGLGACLRTTVQVVRFSSLGKNASYRPLSGGPAPLPLSVHAWRYAFNTTFLRNELPTPQQHQRSRRRSCEGQQATHEEQRRYRQQQQQQQSGGRPNLDDVHPIAIHRRPTSSPASSLQGVTSVVAENEGHCRFRSIARARHAPSLVNGFVTAGDLVRASHSTSTERATLNGPGSVRPGERGDPTAVAVAVADVGKRDDRAAEVMPVKTDAQTTPGAVAALRREWEERVCGRVFGRGLRDMRLTKRDVYEEFLNHPHGVCGVVGAADPGGTSGGGSGCPWCRGQHSAELGCEEESQGCGHGGRGEREGGRSFGMDRRVQDGNDMEETAADGFSIQRADEGWHGDPLSACDGSSSSIADTRAGSDDNSCPSLLSFLSYRPTPEAVLRAASRPLSDSLEVAVHHAVHSTSSILSRSNWCGNSDGGDRGDTCGRRCSGGALRKPFPSMPGAGNATFTVRTAFGSTSGRDDGALGWLHVEEIENSGAETKSPMVSAETRCWWIVDRTARVRVVVLSPRIQNSTSVGSSGVASGGAPTSACGDVGAAGVASGLEVAKAVMRGRSEMGEPEQEARDLNPSEGGGACACVDDGLGLRLALLRKFSICTEVVTLGYAAPPRLAKLRSSVSATSGSRASISGSAAAPLGASASRASAMGETFVTESIEETRTSSRRHSGSPREKHDFRRFGPDGTGAASETTRVIGGVRVLMRSYIVVGATDVSVFPSGLPGGLPGGGNDSIGQSTHHRGGPIINENGYRVPYRPSQDEHAEATGSIPTAIRGKQQTSNSLTEELDNQTSTSVGNAVDEVGIKTWPVQRPPEPHSPRKLAPPQRVLSVSEALVVSLSTPTTSAGSVGRDGTGRKGGGVMRGGRGPKLGPTHERESVSVRGLLREVGFRVLTDGGAGGGRREAAEASAGATAKGKATAARGAPRVEGAMPSPGTLRDDAPCETEEAAMRSSSGLKADMLKVLSKERVQLCLTFEQGADRISVYLGVCAEAWPVGMVPGFCTVQVEGVCRRLSGNGKSVYLAVARAGGGTVRVLSMALPPPPENLPALGWSLPHVVDKARVADTSSNAWSKHAPVVSREAGAAAPSMASAYSSTGGNTVHCPLDVECDTSSSPSPSPLLLLPRPEPGRVLSPTRSDPGERSVGGRRGASAGQNAGSLSGGDEDDHGGGSSADAGDGGSGDGGGGEAPMRIPSNVRGVIAAMRGGHALLLDTHPVDAPPSPPRLPCPPKLRLPLKANPPNPTGWPCHAQRNVEGGACMDDARDGGGACGGGSTRSHLPCRHEADQGPSRKCARATGESALYPPPSRVRSSSLPYQKAALAFTSASARGNIVDASVASKTVSTPPTVCSLISELPQQRKGATVVRSPITLGSMCKRGVLVRATRKFSCLSVVGVRFAKVATWCKNCGLVRDKDLLLRRCWGRCDVRSSWTVRWEGSANVDDGTAQALLLLDGEDVAKLLRLSNRTRSLIETAARLYGSVSFSGQSGGNSTNSVELAAGLGPGGASALRQAHELLASAAGRASCSLTGVSASCVQTLPRGGASTSNSSGTSGRELDAPGGVRGRHGGSGGAGRDLGREYGSAVVDVMGGGMETLTLPKLVLQASSLGEVNARQEGYAILARLGEL